MRVQVVSAFRLGRVGDVFEGTLIDFPEAEARYKIRQGFVREVPPETEPTSGQQVIQTPEGGGSGLRHFTSRDPSPATQDPKPAGRRRGKKGGT